MLRKIIKRIDCSFKPVIIFPLLAAIFTVPAIKFLPIEYFYENHIIENMQLFILFVTFLLCLNTRIDKKFYNALALVCVILFLREINCGRTIFFAVEGMENTFLSWKEIPYGYLAHPLYGAFMAASGLYFIVTKSYMVLYNYLINAKISIYNWLFLIVGMVLAIFSEKTGNGSLEEMMETMFYLALMALIYLQAYNDEYIEAVKDTED